MVVKTSLHAGMTIQWQQDGDRGWTSLNIASSDSVAYFQTSSAGHIVQYELISWFNKKKLLYDQMCSLYLHVKLLMLDFMEPHIIVHTCIAGLVHNLCTKLPHRG